MSDLLDPWPSDDGERASEGSLRPRKLDEIIGLPRAVEEVLYPAMEDFQIDVVLGKGPGARSLRLDLPRFTLVAATTRTGLITSPLRDAGRRRRIVARPVRWAAQPRPGSGPGSSEVLTSCRTRARTSSSSSSC